ncbi:hypothetical protein GQ600_15486 [Phytophthora cactorum]|nr:hypothetical protein GQ600_15486 [Phytophthora cactorum]
MRFSSADSRGSVERDEGSDASVELGTRTLVGREETRYLADDVDPLRPLVSAVLIGELSTTDAALKNSVSFGMLSCQPPLRLLTRSVGNPHNAHRPSLLIPQRFLRNEASRLRVRRVSNCHKYLKLFREPKAVERTAQIHKKTTKASTNSMD